jgi:glycosyltransferase involved in cell wall biosynthesis
MTIEAFTLPELAQKVVPFALPSVSAVIPTLNEAKNLPWLLPRMPSWVSEIIIVDGRSTDNTLAVALAERPDVRVVLETRPGKGSALRAGFAAATGDIVVMLDADGSMDPDEIILFIGALMSGADYVKGSRFIQGAGTEDMSLFRMAGNWGLTLAVRMLYGGSFSDLCYGYVAFWRKYSSLFEGQQNGFEIETLMNVRALKAGLKIVEVASFEANRLFGESNLRAIPDGWRVLKAILQERLAPLPQNALASV